MSRLLSSVALAAVGAVLATAAVAADLPVKAPMYAAPAFSWTGFYIGAHVGAGWGKGDTTSDSIAGVPTNFALAQVTTSGFLGGVQGGYNWQVNPLFVVGLEGDFSWADINGTAPCLTVFSCGGKAKWVGDITARAGVTVDRALIYLKGGAAWANADYTFSVGGAGGFTSTTNDTRIGALLGLGVEYAVTRNWSAKVEYNFIDFGKDSETFAVLGTTAVSTIDQQLHVIKAGVNYRW